MPIVKTKWTKRLAVTLCTAISPKLIAPFCRQIFRAPKGLSREWATVSAGPIASPSRLRVDSVWILSYNTCDYSK